MRVTTLSIGDELLYGEVVDSNAAHIGQRLYLSGLRVLRHMTVGDVEEEIVDALTSLAAGSDALIVTGGLGPTVDDVTARAAAKATGCPLVVNEEALAHARKFAGKLGGSVHALNDRQAFIPEGSLLIPNPTGTACGFDLSHNGCSIFFMPGVPVEMGAMLDQTVIPRLMQRQGAQTFLATRMFRIFGLSEAEVGARLEELAFPSVTIAFGLDFPEVHLKLRAGGKDAASVNEALECAAGIIRQRFGECILGEDDDTIDSVLAVLFRQKRMTLSLAESCTGGLVAKRITDMPGSSDYFLAGAVTYADAAKTRMVGVPGRLLSEHGAVSAETALAMAEGIRKESGSDLALAVTGIAGPGGGTPTKPVGTVFLAIASPGGPLVKEYRFSGNRQEIRAITAFTALDWLRRKLLSL